MTIAGRNDDQGRILYAWADLYNQQLQSGEDYGTPRPTGTPERSYES